jgi:radical SAM-linked protein
MRIRFRFSKLGKIRFTSQRDMARMWERALRRAGLPLAYTEGFSPRPQLSFGLALPTGCESLAEYLDVFLDDRRPELPALDVFSLAGLLSGMLPEGIEVTGVLPVEGKVGSLQQLVTSCSWEMYFAGVSMDQLEHQVDLVLEATTVPIVRERKGREEHDDLRPSVLALAVIHREDTADDGPMGVVADLATQPRGVRPVELVRGLIAVAGGVPDQQTAIWASAGGSPQGVPVLARACRTQQWIERDGVREEPLQLRGSSLTSDRAMHALERAS